MAQSEIDDSWQALDSVCIDEDYNRLYLGLRQSFPLQGYAHVPELVPSHIIAEINAAADRRGSRARRNSKTISGSTIQARPDHCRVIPSTPPHTHTCLFLLQPCVLSITSPWHLFSD